MPNFVLQTPSLQQLAGIKAIAALWNQPDILDLFVELSASSEEDDIEWRTAKGKMESHVLALEITKPCKQQLLKLIKPLGYEIFVWCTNLPDEDTFDIPLLRGMFPRNFCWTMHSHRLCENGRVDGERRKFSY